MKDYILIKQVKARQMSRGNYNHYRGWVIPEDENPDDDGYLVKNSDVHENWMPSDEFLAYRKLGIQHLLLKGSREFTLVEFSNHKFNAYHNYVVKADDKVVSVINFQEGPIKENGINGCHHEDLINIVIHRLESFQDSEFKCRENALAITKLEEAIHWLKHRTDDRKNRQVEGTSKI